MRLRYRAAGMSRADVMVAIVVLVVLLAFVWPVLSTYYRVMGIKDMYARCGRNLATLGKAISAYASDYDGMPPIAGGPGVRWGPALANWAAEERTEAFGLSPEGTGGQATISSSLYLLIRYADLTPDSFVCPLEKQTRVFEPKQYGMPDKPLSALWDFGPDPARHCSYAYQMVYGQFHPQTPRRLVLPIAADRNPWIDSPFGKAQDFSLFDPDKTPFKGGRTDAALGNSMAHGEINQNVLYLDGHVELIWRSFHTIAGYQMLGSGEHHELKSIEEDNVYTSWDGDDRKRGTPPKPYESRPVGEFDSLLVNDPPLRR